MVTLCGCTAAVPKLKMDVAGFCGDESIMELSCALLALLLVVNGLLNVLGWLWPNVNEAALFVLPAPNPPNCDALEGGKEAVVSLLLPNVKDWFGG